MFGLNGFISKQGQLLLANNRYALVWASLLAIVPYTTWLALAAIALITLRKGWREGFLMMLPTMVAHCLFSLTSLSVETALINSIVTFMPCYFAACALLLTTNWQAVAGLFFLVIVVVAMLLQVFLPEFILAQSTYLITLLKEAQPDSALTDYLQNVTAIKQTIIANYLLGMQLLMVAFSATIPLLLARSVQAKLFYPEGFKQEILMFQGSKIGLILFGVLIVAAMQDNLVAIDILPAFVFYFLVAGLSCSAHVLIKKKYRGVLIILLTPLVLLPFVMLPAYVVLGSLDSLFNLRMHFAKKHD